jgi:cytochrome c oxidase cbb3-type subunit 3
LTDDYYKNVKKITDIAEVIKNGAAGGSMPAWRTRLHPNEVVLMAAYVAGLRGKNLPGRGPEGEKIDPWPFLLQSGESVGTGQFVGKLDIPFRNTAVEKRKVEAKPESPKK